MKQLVLLAVIFLTFCLSAFGQERPPCYEKTRKAGIDKYNAGKYDDAVDYFVQAKKCWDKTENNDLDTQIAKCNAAKNKPKESPKSQTSQQTQQTQQSQPTTPTPHTAIVQPPPVPDKLTVSTQSVLFEADYEAEAPRTVSLDTNRDAWNVTTDPDLTKWCRVERNGNRALKLTCTSPNLSTDTRRGLIRIIAGSLQLDINVEQRGLNRNNALTLAQRFEKKGRTDEAAICYGVCADYGNMDCKSWLGTFYLKAGNYSKAFTLLKEGASHGDRRAQNNLGVMFENGLGTAKDEHAAVYYYNLSADQDYPEAYYNLARMYQHGLGGLRKNISEAKILFGLAAKNGDRDAQNILDTQF
jgi:tetratricopeptide (TPR) repeat protein